MSNKGPSKDKSSKKDEPKKQEKTPSDDTEHVLFGVDEMLQKVQRSVFEDTEREAETRAEIEAAHAREIAELKARIQSLEADKLKGRKNRKKSERESPESGAIQQEGVRSSSPVVTGAEGGMAVESLPEETEIEENEVTHLRRNNQKLKKDLENAKEHIREIEKREPEIDEVTRLKRLNQELQRNLENTKELLKQAEKRLYQETVTVSQQSDELARLRKVQEKFKEIEKLAKSQGQRLAGVALYQQDAVKTLHSANERLVTANNELRAGISEVTREKNALQAELSDSNEALGELEENFTRAEEEIKQAQELIKSQSSRIKALETAALESNSKEKPKSVAEEIAEAESQMPELRDSAAAEITRLREKITHVNQVSAATLGFAMGKNQKLNTQLLDEKAKGQKTYAVEREKRKRQEKTHAEELRKLRAQLEAEQKRASAAEAELAREQVTHQKELGNRDESIHGLKMKNQMLADEIRASKTIRQAHEPDQSKPGKGKKL